MVVNNAADDRSLAITFSGLQVEGMLTGAKLFGHARWQAREPIAVESARRMRTLVRARSVTTLCVPLAGDPPTESSLPAAVGGHSP